MAETLVCPHCRKVVRPTKDGRVPIHRSEVVGEDRGRKPPWCEGSNKVPLDWEDAKWMR